VRRESGISGKCFDPADASQLFVIVKNTNTATQPLIAAARGDSIFIRACERAPLTRGFTRNSVIQRIRAGK
jgi:hypothetical protein